MRIAIMRIAIMRIAIMRIKLLPFLLAGLGLVSSLHAQPDLGYYLPQDVRYDPAIPTPEAFLGYQVGEWHVSHDQLRYYFTELARASDRVSLEAHGKTYEGRPILLLTITSAENHSKLADIQAQHLQLTQPDRSAALDVTNMPAVLWMGYSIHGNEASGSNAALLVAYYLAAAQGEEVERWLDETIILFDPSYNPDGFQRFSTWVNMHRGIHEVSRSPDDREHNEAWPGGRTNHYWFDLNRDWLPVQHPESRARIRKFHEWKPNWLTDHHEMGTNSTFFFQPGVPSRTHPLTPAKVTEFANQLGNFHAQALDSIGSLYFTQERYDDFYYGKGSTYPDVNGSVGILFEQASARGHQQDSENGLLTFPFAIRNQVVTSFSTLRGVNAIRVDLLAYQREFFRTALQEARQEARAAFVFGDQHAPVRSYELLKILRQHDITVHRLGQDLEVDGKRFLSEASYLVPLEQRQYRLIKAMFETQLSFQDSLFYDISTWTFPLAFNLPYAALDKRAYRSGLLGEELKEAEFPMGQVVGNRSDYAYVMKWHTYLAPRALNQLHARGLRTKVATRPFRFGDRSFEQGSILVPVRGQSLPADQLYTLLRELATTCGVHVHALETGLSEQGPDLGSGTFELLEPPKIALLVGEGFSSYEAGEVWHLLDQRFRMPLVKVDVADLGRTDLTAFNTLVMVSGGRTLSERDAQQLREWVQEGGKLIGLRNAVQWLAQNGFLQLSYQQRESNKPSPVQLPYGNRSNRSGAQVTGGAIFEVQLDLTHPLAYGYLRDRLPVFRNHNQFIAPSSSPYGNPILYTEEPLLSGYISSPNLSAVKSSSAASLGRMGSGRVIGLVDNPNFRAFWYGTNRLFMNALFFGGMM